MALFHHRAQGFLLIERAKRFRVNQGQEWFWGSKKDQRGWREEGQGRRVSAPLISLFITESKDSHSQKPPITCELFHYISKELNISLGQKATARKRKELQSQGRAAPRAQFLFYLWVQRETKLGLVPVEQCSAVYTQPGPGETLQLCGRCSWMQNTWFYNSSLATSPCLTTAVTSFCLCFPPPPPLTV